MMFFSYSSIMQDHLTLTAYTCLTISFVAMYVFKLNIVRLGFFLGALALAFVAGRINYLGGAIILGFALLFYFAYHANKVIVRKIAFLLVLLCAVGLMIKRVPGINNWPVLQGAYLTDDAIAYSMYFTFDKSLIGLLFIWFSAYSLANGGKWKPVMKTGFLCGLAAMVVLLPLSLILGYVKFDPKFSPLFFIWALNNLIFVSIAEEALFRGMIQQTMMSWWQNYKIGKWLALIITAALFGAAHYKGGDKYMLLAGVAGLLYGYAYMKTKKIEASVLTHFMVNSTHFVFFTYPALASAFN